MKWDDVYREAVRCEVSTSGYYHRNIPAEVDGSMVIVRIPLSRSPGMDLRLWPEPEILRSIEGHIDNAPKVLHVSQDPAFQVHGFIPGTVLNDLAPRGVPVPEHVLTATASLFARLAGIPVSRLPAVEREWPDDGDTCEFAQRLNADSRRVFAANLAVSRRLYESLAIPDDPFEPVQHLWGKMAQRKFVLVHADVHRKNIIVNERSSFFLDWELALYGDPVYELAAHIHKTSYLPYERDLLVERWFAAMPPPATAGYAPDLAAYLMHEQIKSVLVDAVRYAEAFDGAAAPYPPDVLVAKLSEMLAVARRHWGIATAVDKLEVEAALRP